MSNGVLEARFLGIDESNHGRSPEIFVAAYSSDPNQAIMSKLDKERQPSNLVTALLDTMDSVLDMRYIIFTKQMMSQFKRSHNIKQIALIEFIGQAKGLDLALFDGELNQSHLNIVRREDPRVLVEVRPKADETYALVHAADKMANILYHLYSRQAAIPQRVRSKLIEPDIAYYRRTLR